MLFLYIIITLETPLRIPRILMTTPINAYDFTHQLDTPEDFFLSYPALKVKNDTLYFKGSSKVLLLVDGVPVSSLNVVCFLAIDKVEVVAQNMASLYGDYDAVVNIITKKPKAEIPYSKVRLNKNPDYVEFEFGRKILNPFDLNLASNLGPPSKFNANLGWAIPKIGTTLRAYYIDEFILQGASQLGSCSYIKFYLKQELFSITNLCSIKRHKILLGTDNGEAFFIQDYWEPYPLLYVMPALRYDTLFYPQISASFIPYLNVVAFSSLTQNQSLIGVRVFDFNLSVFRDKTGEYELETRLVSPWICNFKLTLASYLQLANYQIIKLLDYCAVMLEYQQEFKKGDLGVYVLGDINNLRLEFKIIDVKLFYRLQESSSCYGMSWEFWD